MNTPLKLLLVEDSETDARLLVRQLEKQGFQLTWERVETAAAMRAALMERSWDCILSDHNMPAFDAPGALAVLKEFNLDLPFIVVSGSIGEALAVAMMRAGAHDYLLKDDLSRLAPAIERELRDAEMRRQRRRAEKELRDSQALYCSLVENLPQCVLRKDLAGRITFANESFGKLLGRPVQEIIGKTDFDLFPAEQARKYQEDDRQVAVTGRILESVEENWASGEIRWMQVVKTPLRDAEGAVTGVQAIFWDITEKKRAAEALARNEAELSAIYEHAPVILLLLDLDRRIQRFNRAAVDFFGRPESELKGLRGGELLGCIHALDDPRGCGYGPVCETCPMRQALADTMATGATHRRVVCSVTAQKAGRQKRIAILASTALVKFDGRPMVLFCLEDITEKAAMEEQLLRTQRIESVGALASGLAHDFNNILSPIMMASEMMRLKAADEQERRSLEIIHGCAQRGAQIVRQLLAFGRGLEGATMDVEPKGLIRDIRQIVNETFPKNIALKTQVPGDIGVLKGDPTQFHQMLLNLCVNARDAMPQGGVLTVQGDAVDLDEVYAAVAPDAKPGRYFRLRVMDTGLGIAPEHLDRIFDPFFTTKPAGKGTGLGLASVLGIVKKHGGLIHVTSQPNQGACFEVLLPLFAASATSPASGETPALPQGAGETILLVDDENTLRQVTHRALLSHGYRVLVANDGAEAVSLFAEHKAEIRLVLADLEMPVLSGPQMLQILRRMNPHLPVVIISGLADQEKRLREINPQNLWYLPKPFNVADLLAKTRLALESWAAQPPA